MSTINPSMRLKTKGDTFFIPDPNGGVYFRNNSVSFRMEGRTIYQWIEKLIPMFNGEHTLEELTDGLSDPYRDRVYEIAELLYQNGFVQDVSQDRPHQLANEVLKKYAPQIKFLDSFGDSGAYRFQTYRQAKVLAVGSGPFFVSLVAALFESGLPRFHVLVTDSVPTNRQRMEELAEYARKTDSEVTLEEVTPRKERVNSWQEAVRMFDAILYVSQQSDVEELRVLHAICREEKKVFLPAVCLQQMGLAGPLVHPDSEGCWESAWRRIHKSVLCKDPQLHTFSSTAGAMLANVIVFELFKTVTGITQSEKNKFFLLDLETLEGNWHCFIPHPLVTRHAAAERVQDLDLRLKRSSVKSESNGLLPAFSRLTSAQSGIFHIWEEGDLKQLPLAQCRVQAADPLSEGPADLLPELVCTGLTHEEARREAGLAGIEAYLSRMLGLLVTTHPSQQEVEGRMEAPEGFVGVGAGETVAEGVCRGLQKCLTEELRKQQTDQKPSVLRVQLSAVEDERCRFYLETLTTIKGIPVIGLAEEVFGFPVVWVGTDGSWYGSAGLNMTTALQKALQQALFKAQNHAVCPSTQALEVSSVFLEEKAPQRLVIPACEEAGQSELLQSALQILNRNRKRLMVFDLAVEPFLKEELGAVFGVLVREEESR
ncbi:putative thiazole-containing bacteriocin maturation protein [Paenactinomyces guangxiensis]|uniref:Putative thiazole-containing bacteriocin maturation protein n=1 Tax=Paenactinomyces guangxiensis TaxID=1490290 RepID=A0A7W2A9L2_9BACL|nr:putative thiazole-containing bacteriocin maturation protein [Paenactinomyces guangxiensis]MBA4495317.1 putative thiazole-containing bacteriocin maturation protein [Paenactinomyces guangxiensis]MBH8592561.1 putative thiazole-containing bacteriocin maturation protein [Paenactinomyces guangxiensis]